jgi:hypothetical protein
VEIASDSGFNSRVHVADKVPAGDGGRTTYQVPVALQAGGTVYYWRVRGLDGANTGDYSAVAHFQVDDPVVIAAPTPASPAGNATVDTLTPDLIVANGQATGPMAGPVIYRFELALDAGFGNLVAVLTAPRSGASTTMVRPTPLAYDVTYFWRVSASDGVVTSPYSATASFRTAAPPPPPPPPPPTVAPPPSSGGGSGGGSAPTPSTPTPPSGGGARTPDPPAGQRLPLPNMAWVVDEVAARHPAALRNSCQEHGGTWEFMDRLVDRLRQFDTRWGYNWKRGNVGDPSLDVVAYNYGAGRDEGTTNVYIIDVIVGHCGNNPGPGWIDQTDATVRGGGIGRWTGRGRF